MGVTYNFKPIRESSMAIHQVDKAQEDVMLCFGLTDNRIKELSGIINAAIEKEFRGDGDISSSNVLEDVSQFCTNKIELACVAYCVGAWFIRIVMSEKNPLLEFLREVNETANALSPEPKPRRKKK